MLLIMCERAGLRYASMKGRSMLAWLRCPGMHGGGGGDGRSNGAGACAGPAERCWHAKGGGREHMLTLPSCAGILKRLGELSRDAISVPAWLCSHPGGGKGRGYTQTLPSCVCIMKGS